MHLLQPNDKLLEPVFNIENKQKETDEEKAVRLQNKVSSI